MKSKFILLVGIGILALALSGCFLFQSNPITSYFPENKGEATIAIYSTSTSNQIVVNITYASTSFNNHSDLVATYKATGGSINVYFWRNSSGQVYWDGMTGMFNGTTQITTIDGFRMIDNVNTGINQSPITFVATATTNGNPYPETFVRTSEIISNLNVQGKIYKDVLHVSFTTTPNTYNNPPLDVYFANGVGIIRIKGQLMSSQVITIDLVNSKVNGTSTSSKPMNLDKFRKGVAPFFKVMKK